MYGLIVRFGLAAHLALLAVAPLFLYPTCGEAFAAKAMLWLSLLAFAWSALEPIPVEAEGPHDARWRFACTLWKDPLVWTFAAVALYALLRMANSGVGMEYDGESWKLVAPWCGALPGCVAGEGLMPFAAALSSLVVVAGVRRSLSPDARSAFAALLLALAAAALVSAVQRTIRFGAEVPPSFGAASGVGVVLAAAALYHVCDLAWFGGELMVVLATAGCGVALVRFGSALSLVAFGSAYALVWLYSLVMAKVRFAPVRFFRYLFMALLPPVAVAVFAAVSGFAMPAFDGGACGPLTDVAVGAWETSRWTGTGLGSFPLDVRFFASEEAWPVLQRTVGTSVPGLASHLAECGLVGALALVSAAGMLLWFAFRGIVQSVRRRQLPMPFQVLALPLAAALAAVAVFSRDFIIPTVTLLAVSSLAVASSSFGSKQKGR